MILVSLAVVGRRDKNFRGGAAFLLKLGRITYRFTVPPRNKSSLEKRRYKKMFQGKTIEELINSVVRAEDHAREQEKKQAPVLERQYQFRPFVVRQEMVEVA